jgi:peptidoglycan/xylan/chitin deacetylase (PgdA/CDA1 family)
MKRHIVLVSIIFILAGFFFVPYDKADTAQTKPDTAAPSLVIPDNMKDFKEYIPILVFHYIEDVPRNVPDQLRYRLSFPAEKLDQFCAFFKEHNIETLTFWDMKDIIEGKRKKPEKAVMLTFDDGYLDDYKNAFPILKKYGMKGVFFIISKFPDNDPNYATWAQLKEMSDNGQEIASHSVTHPDLRLLDDKKLAYELEASKKTIEEKIGKPVISFCYPSGKYDNKVREVAKKNYIFARSTISGRYFSVKKLYDIPIVRIFPTSSVKFLEILFKESTKQAPKTIKN